MPFIGKVEPTTWLKLYTHRNPLLPVVTQHTLVRVTRDMCISARMCGPESRDLGKESLTGCVDVGQQECCVQVSD
jgi:hypothetical protein